MSNFKAIAQKETVLCPIMAGRTKIESADIYGKELTITDFDFAPKRDTKTNEIVVDENGIVQTYAVVLFEEIPDGYYNCGEILSRVCQAWMEGYEAPEEASADLKKEGGVPVVLEKGKTNGGNNITTVTIL